jgi:Arc/MetJ-type ribon-helix-helix transcriptional regulator
MKGRVSATIDPETNRILSDLLKRGRYRNQSHIIEEAIKMLGEKEKHEKR